MACAIARARAELAVICQNRALFSQSGQFSRIWNDTRMYICVHKQDFLWVRLAFWHIHCIHCSFWRRLLSTALLRRRSSFCACITSISVFIARDYEQRVTVCLAYKDVKTS